MHGVARIGFAARDRRTRLATLYQQAPLRVLFPRAPAGDPSHAVLVTTSGGLVGTELFIEVEEDRTTYGEEVKFGGGKVIRDGQGQSQNARRQGVVDTVITNALILDHWGIVKADIGIRDGRIAGIGKAGNPNTQPDVDIVIGPATEAIAGEGKIVTAGGFDCHVHYICPQQIDEALYSGITTLLGGAAGRDRLARVPAARASRWAPAAAAGRRSRRPDVGGKPAARQGSRPAASGAGVAGGRTNAP